MDTKLTNIHDINMIDTYLISIYYGRFYRLSNIIVKNETL